MLPHVGLHLFEHIAPVFPLDRLLTIGIHVRAHKLKGLHLSPLDRRLSAKLPASYPWSIWKISRSVAIRSPLESSKRASTRRVAQGVNTPIEAPQPFGCALTSRDRHCPPKSGRSYGTGSVIISRSSPPTHDPNIATGRWPGGECVRKSKMLWSTHQSGERPGPPEHLKENESKRSGREEGRSAFANLPTWTCDRTDMLPPCP